MVVVGIGNRMTDGSGVDGWGSDGLGLRKIGGLDLVSDGLGVDEQGRVRIQRIGWHRWWWKWMVRDRQRN